MRSDIKAGVEAGTLAAGANLLATGKTVSDRPSSFGVPANTLVRAVTSAPATNQTLLTAGMVRGTALAGNSSLLGKTGIFLPLTTLSSWLTSGSGLVLSEGLVIGEGLVLSEGLGISEGLVVSEAGQPNVKPGGKSSVLGE